MKQPLDDVRWLRADTLRPNTWNPNFVLSQEMRLLEHSLLTNGWIQPIVINTSLLIIDGFHRWRLSIEETSRVFKQFSGMVPCVTLEIGDGEAKLLTVRINRAKGSHQGHLMAQLVQQLVYEDGFTEEQIARGIGATLPEVRLLCQNSIFKHKNLESYEYSKAWVPKRNETL